MKSPTEGGGFSLHYGSGTVAGPRRHQTLVKHARREPKHLIISQNYIR
jgi:hypothetical protein